MKQLPEDAIPITIQHPITGKQIKAFFSPSKFKKAVPTTTKTIEQLKKQIRAFIDNNK